jgi:oligopeptide transport system substrate-binding protein
MKWKTKLYFICLSILVILFYGCKDPNADIDQSLVFKYNQQANITSLDPAFAKSQNNMWCINHVYNTLIKLDDSLKMIPSIAKSWSISSDGLVYSFLLRDDVFFHDDPCFNGMRRRLTAQDVVYSFRRLIDSTLSSPGSWIFSDKVDSSLPFEAQSDSNFILRLKYPFVPMLNMLTMQYCSVVPREAVTYYKENFRAHPVGSGPYKFKRWLDNQALFLTRNDQYFESNFFAQNSPQYIKTSMIPDKQIAALELLNGKVDLISGLESSFINEYLDSNGKLKDNKKDKVVYIRSPYLNTEYIGINQELAKLHPGLKNKNFRQALNYAVDRTMLLSSLRNGVGQPATSGFTPKGLPSFDESKVKGYYYDPDLAKNLIKKSGVDLSKMPPITIHTNAEYLDMATFVTNQWEQIGIKCKIELMDTGVLRDGMRNSRLELFRASWIADYPDAESYLTVFYSKNPSPPNYTRYSNPSFDVLYEKAVRTTDEKVRFELYQLMEKIVLDDAPMIFLFYDESSIFINKNIKGYTNNGLNLLNINKLVKNAN